MELVLRVQEWHELVAIMLFLPHHHQTMLLVVCLAAVSLRSPEKLMHNCTAVSLIPSSKGRAELFVWHGKGVGWMLFFSRSGVLMIALHTDQCYQGFKMNLEFFVKKIFFNCKRFFFIESSTDSCCVLFSISSDFLCGVCSIALLEYFPMETT